MACPQRAFPALLAALLAVCWFGSLRSASAQDEEAGALVSVEPAVRGSFLVCGVTTRGLPDVRSRQTLASGLPSSVVFGFSILDSSGERLRSAEAEVRIEPDLWEGTFLVRAPGSTRRVTALGDVVSLLERMPAFPVFPLAELSPEVVYRVRVRLAVHPLAPSEIRRSRALLTGDDLEEPGRREVSVGITSLLRLFLGDEGSQPWRDDLISAPFRVSGLPRLPGPVPEESP